MGYSWSQGEGHGVYVPENPHKMAVILEDPRQEVVCHNAKFEVTHLKNNGITLTSFHDTKIAAYLLGLPSTHLKDLAVQELGLTPITYSEVTDGKDMSELTPEEILDYAAADADNTLRLWYELRTRLERNLLYSVYEDIEMPLIPVLSDMERCGVQVSIGQAIDAISFFENKMIQAEARAHEEIPLTVSIGSPEQLARWLEVQGAPILKRTEGKGLLATDENTLRSLNGWREETINAILDYRMFRKLSAFPKKFIELSAWDGALHPNFNQGGYYEESSDTSGSAPATGRLSC